MGTSDCSSLCSLPICPGVEVQWGLAGVWEEWVPFPEAPDIPLIPVCQGYLWNGPCLCVCVYLWACVHAWCVLYMSVSMCPCIKMILTCGCKSLGLAVLSLMTWISQSHLLWLHNKPEVQSPWRNLESKTRREYRVCLSVCFSV